MSARFDLTVVIPTLNEEGSLGLVLSRLKAVFLRLSLRGEMIVVDGRSTDNTVVAAVAGGARVLTQIGDGLGGALRTGLQAAHAPWIAVMDADGSHPPEVLPEMWAKRSAADIVIASRYIPGGAAVMGPMRRALSRALNGMTRFALDVPVFDSSGGFRLYRAELARAACADSRAEDFTIQQELLIGILSRGGNILEIPFRYESRLDGVSKASAWRLAPAYIRMLLRLRAWREE